ncbi:MAG TPA: hypothetical protein PLC15_23285 [Candidatus Obscuribacter sp.]|nr:hypothetical protein [Candidatus Obscuribacter sp.]HNG75655.1 hypothetical protein [Candidatus Obscuribacter sp.]
MTTLNIISGCDGQSAEQFNEGTEIHVRVCNAEAARLVVFCEDPSHISVSVDGENTFESMISANHRHEFALKDVLLPRKQRRNMAASGFMALFGGGRSQSGAKSQPEREPVPMVFTVEIRTGSSEGPIEGTYHYRLLPNADFARRLEGFLGTRTPEVERPIFSPDARPASQIILGLPRCPSCGDAISDPIVGCENAECPTHQSDQDK